MVVGLATVLLSTSAWSQALEDRPPPARRLVHRGLVAARYNPVGLYYEGRLSYRLRLYRDESLALRDNYAGGGAMVMLTPAFLRVGPYVELAPASFVTVWSTLQYSAYFGSFGMVQSFPSPRSDFSDDELDRLEGLPDGDPRANQSTSGLELTVGVDLQARVGPVAVRSQSRFIRADLDLRGDDRVFYDQATDLLMPDAGLSLTSDLDAAYLAMGGRLVLAARYTAAVPFYPASSYLPGEPEDSDNATHRVGPIVAYTFHSRDGARFNMPTVLVIAQWWIDHRYRTGQESSQALPLIAVGFRFHGDLLALD